MPANKATLSRWYDRGVEQGATHMIVKCDTFDYRGGPDDDCCYPVYVQQGEDAREREAANSDRLMEVYDLRIDKSAQIDANGRVFNY